MNDPDPTIPSAETPEEVRLAADALQRAKAEFEKAQAAYESVRHQAAEHIKAVREATVGELLDHTLSTVRRYPGASLSVAAAVGFFLGRLFRR